MMTSTAHESAITPEIGKYHLVAELARGGMGNVYLAAAQGPGGFSKLLVVKELKPELAEDETYVSMFLDEARLAARLNHPSIVQTNEVGSDGKRHFMVMEFLDGRSLHRIGKRLEGRFPVGAHLRVISEALLGLHYAHEMREFDGAPLGIVHRDVSPLNIFVTFAGQAKVLDFGIAKTVDSSLETKMGVLKGRVAYMSPEQAKGAKVDRRADIYSAGVMLWEAAAGRRLWPGKSEVEILTEILRDGPPALRSVRPDAPQELEHICARAMAFDREERYATALDLVHDLDAHLARRADTMTMREVGAMVGQAFADERRKMNVIIDEALTRVRGSPNSGVMPAFHAPVSGTLSSAKIVRNELGSLRVFTPSQGFAPNSCVSSLGALSHSAPTPSIVGPPQPDPRFRTWTSKRVALVTAGGGALLLGAILVGSGLSTGRQPVSTPAVAAPAIAIAHEDPQLIDVAVHVSPSSAQITIDGASVVNNPFRSRYPKDNQIHHIVAVAEGYESKMEDVSFASDVSIDVSLHRANVALRQVMTAAPSAAPMRFFRRVTSPAPSGVMLTDMPAPAPATGTRPEVNPNGGRVPLRPISTNNPYGNP